MSDIHGASHEERTTRSEGDEIAIVPAEPHVDPDGVTAPPWTVPDPYDSAAVEQPELVAPMKSPRKLAEVSRTSAPRFVKTRVGGTSAHPGASLPDSLGA